jgi:putative nucleotidyltransferase with HDIG domain
MNEKNAREWWDEFHTPLHVRQHCEKVATVGRFLAEKLKEKGVSVNPDTVYAAGLLHDVVRVVDFKTLSPNLGTAEDPSVWTALREKSPGQHHADAGAELLKAKGEPELADIVRRHKYGSLLTREKPTTWEAKLLYYADKRVAHDQIVSIQERLDEGHRRHYPDAPVSEDEKKRRAAVRKLEKEIFKPLDFTPNELISLLKRETALPTRTRAS